MYVKPKQYAYVIEKKRENASSEPIVSKEKIKEYRELLEEYSVKD